MRFPPSRFAIAAGAIGAALLVLVAALTPLVLLAQYRVNTQVGAVNRQIYGSGGASATSVRYAPQYRTSSYTTPGATSQMMRSEIRYSYARSGELRSNIKMGYNALGPQTPGGPTAYIPPKPAYMTRDAAGGPQGNRVSPMATSSTFTGMSPYAVPTSTRYAGSAAASTGASASARATPYSNGFVFGSTPGPLHSSVYTGGSGPTPMNPSIRYGG